jgi:ectoine hydroxylase-related dioxygenase (phytanoyl-CoA dioxygenase family)
MEELEVNISGWFEKLVSIHPLVESSSRKLLPLDKLVEKEIASSEDVNKCKQILRKITRSLLLEKLKGPSWKAFQIVECDLVIAGKISKSSNGHSPCPVHRDGEFKEGLDNCELLTASVLLDDLNKDNGSVKFWKDSVQFPHCKKHPNRYIDKEPDDRTYTWEGAKGTMLVWDARMLHQSLPNKSNETTLKLAWAIMSKRYITRLLKNEKEKEKVEKQEFQRDTANVRKKRKKQK